MSQELFPFGSPVKKVEQKDRSPKDVFVLGVYASAVHAKWINEAGKLAVRALAVASEPEIFWRGDTHQALNIIESIKLPKGCGKLLPADEQFNGPSGRSLDDLFLHPLGSSREKAWLCDLLPYARLNPGQKTALFREYEPLVKAGNLPKVSLAEVPKKFADDQRIKEITKELMESKAKTIITLGDVPIREFMAKESDSKILTLRGLGEYGIERTVIIAGQMFKWIALVHPRQAGKLGLNSAEWEQKHLAWMMANGKGK